MHHAAMTTVQNDGTSIPQWMEALVLDDFGPDASVRIARIDVEPPGRGQVLVRLAASGIGSWDPFERDGGYAEMTGQKAQFPYVLGSDGAGIISAVGTAVGDLSVGERVWCSGFLDPDATFYAAATLVPAEMCAVVPDHLDITRAAGLPGAGLTALRGLVDVLDVGEGDRVAITGASGALGHLAVQLAVGLGASVDAVASGPDGVELVERLGAVCGYDGRAGRGPDPAEVDKALLLAPGAIAEQLAEAVAAAHPTGVAIESARSEQFNGEPDADLTRSLAALVRDHSIDVHVHRMYGPSEIAEAHVDLEKHHLGKLLLDTRALSVGRTSQA